MPYGRFTFLNKKRRWSCSWQRGGQMRHSNTGRRKNPQRRAAAGTQTNTDRHGPTRTSTGEGAQARAAVRAKAHKHGRRCGRRRTSTGGGAGNAMPVRRAAACILQATPVGGCTAPDIHLSSLIGHMRRMRRILRIRRSKEGVGLCNSKEGLRGAVGANGIELREEGRARRPAPTRQLH